MNHSEVRDVILMVESYDLTLRQEYQHIRGAKRIIEGTLQLTESEICRRGGFRLLGNHKAITLHTKQKGQRRNHYLRLLQCRKHLRDDLVTGLSLSLNLITYSVRDGNDLCCSKDNLQFNKTVALNSMDYLAVRVFIAKTVRLSYYRHHTNLHPL